MKLRDAVLVCLACSWLMVANAQTGSLTTFILLRHAERANDGTNDPGLTEVGEARAQRLAKLFEKTKIDAICSTPYKRTERTVAPLASSMGLAIVHYEAMSGEQLDKILATHIGQTVLICGHSNTTPWTANYLLGFEQLKNFEDSDYSNLLILTINKKGQGKLTWLSMDE